MADTIKFLVEPYLKKLSLKDNSIKGKSFIFTF